MTLTNFEKSLTGVLRTLSPYFMAFMSYNQYVNPSSEYTINEHAHILAVVHLLGGLLGTGTLGSLSWGDRFWGSTTATDDSELWTDSVPMPGEILCNAEAKLSNGRQRTLPPPDETTAVAAAAVTGKDISLLSVLVLLVSSINEDGPPPPTLPGDVFSNKCDGISRILCVNMCCFILPCNKCSTQNTEKCIYRKNNRLLCQNRSIFFKG